MSGHQTALQSISGFLPELSFLRLVLLSSASFLVFGKVRPSVLLLLRLLLLCSSFVILTSPFHFLCLVLPKPVFFLPFFFFFFFLPRSHVSCYFSPKSFFFRCLSVFFSSTHHVSKHILSFFLLPVSFTAWYLFLFFYLFSLPLPFHLSPGTTKCSVGCVILLSYVFCLILILLSLFLLPFFLSGV